MDVEGWAAFLMLDLGVGRVSDLVQVFKEQVQPVFTMIFRTISMAPSWRYFTPVELVWN